MRATSEPGTDPLVLLAGSSHAGWRCDSLFVDADGAQGILVTPIETDDLATHDRCPNSAVWRLTFQARDVRLDHNVVGLKCEECKVFLEGAYIAARRL